MTKFSQISIQQNVPQNESLSGKFDNLSVDNIMSHTCGHFEPINSTQSALFIGVMALYFSTFFFEHTVFCILLQVFGYSNIWKLQMD